VPAEIADIVASVPELPHANFLHRRHGRADHAGHGYFERIGNAKAGSMLGRLFDRADNRRMSVAENSRAPGANVIDVLVAIDIINAGALARLTKNGSPPTPRNARTGEFTPPGINSSACAKSSCERFV